MFKITQNTAQCFSLAEILLMAAMNEIEARRKASTGPVAPKESRFQFAMIVDDSR